MKQPHEILGILPTATKEEASKAWKNLLKNNHPDLFQKEDEKKKAEEETKILNKAYDDFTNPKPQNPRGNPFSQGQPVNPNDFFSHIFRNHGGFNPFANPSGNFRFEKIIQHECMVDFYTLYQGGEVETKLPDGKTIKFNLPKNFQPGKSVRCRIIEAQTHNIQESVMADITVRLAFPKLDEAKMKQLRELFAPL